MATRERRLSNAGSATRSRRRLHSRGGGSPARCRKWHMVSRRALRFGAMMDLCKAGGIYHGCTQVE
jgi:hypothetical protein